MHECSMSAKLLTAGVKGILITLLMTFDSSSKNKQQRINTPKMQGNTLEQIYATNKYD